MYAEGWVKYVLYILKVNGVCIIYANELHPKFCYKRRLESVLYNFSDRHSVHMVILQADFPANLYQ